MSYLICTKDACSYCFKAKYLLDTRNIEYQEESDVERIAELMGDIEHKTYPKIFRKSDEGEWIFIGGCDDLVRLIKREIDV